MAAKRAPRPSAPTSRQSFGPKGWLVILGGAATGAIVLAAWLPVGALLNQRAQLSTATTRLAQLSSQGAALSAEARRLATPEELARLAREQYQLVAPGQRLIQVLTPSGAPSSASAGGPFPGDPGLAAPVEPGAQVIVGSGVRASTTPARVVAASPPGFFTRVLAALQFWR